MSDTERPPVPQYGEYAPPGYVPPVPSPTDLKPPPYNGLAAPAAPAGSKRRTWDVVLTVILLIVGLFGATLGCAYGVIFTDPDALRDLLAQQGYPGFDAQPGAVPAVLVISHVILYLLALGGSIPLLVTKRIAFWVPLGAGVVAAIIFWSCMFIIISSDPGFLTTQTPVP